MTATRVHRQIICDPATDARLTWIAHAMRHGLHMIPAQTRPSTIMRRCLDLYVVHLTGLLWPEDVPKDEMRYCELRRLAEAARVRECQQDRDLCVPDDALIALPVRPLSAIVADAATSKPKAQTPMQSIKADLARWDRANRRNDDDDDNEE